MFKKIIFALLATPVKISLTELDSNVPVLAICLPCKHIIEKVKATVLAFIHTIFVLKITFY